MRTLTYALLLIGSLCAESMLDRADAQIRRFPYQATVEGNNVYVRSGPGRSYYPTSKLQNGSRVTVHRHDPGGWYMIAPPEGSFSWIRARYVERTGANQGVLTESNVVVRVGSTFGDSRDIEQVRLSKGAIVTILGESATQSGPDHVKWYKIASPRGEYRWISGRNIVPVGRAARRANDTNPYAIPSNARRDTKPHRHVSLKGSRPKGGPALNGPSLSGGNRDHSGGRSSGAVTSDGYSRHQQKLSALDETFRKMVRRNPRFWDFTQLETGYLRLQNECSHTAMRRKVSSRIAAVNHYKSVKADYDDLIQLTAETSERDSRLAQVQHQLAQRAQLGNAAPVTLADNHEPTQSQTPVDGSATSVPQPALLPSPGTPRGGRPVVRHPVRRPVRLAPPVPGASVPRPQASGPGRSYNGAATSYPQPGTGPQVQHPGNNARRRQFDGAGIIRRVVARTPGMPQHALVAPNGRILAYLQPVPGLPLDQYVGRPMGIYGQRSHRQDLRNDFIVVRAMMPVRLQP